MVILVLSINILVNLIIYFGNVINCIMKITGIFIAIILIVSLAIYFTKYDTKRIQELHNNYKPVNYQESLVGKVNDLYVEKGACFVIIDQKKVFIKTSGNYSYHEVFLDRILSKGDTIIKESESDTLKVLKKKSEYKFVIGKIINR